MTTTPVLPVKEFRITFGGQYNREPHPVLGFIPHLGDGYIVIEAPDHAAARAIAFALLGFAWAFDYPPESYPEDYFTPAGELGRVKLKVEFTMGGE